MKPPKPVLLSARPPGTVQGMDALPGALAPGGALPGPRAASAYGVGSPWAGDFEAGLNIPHNPLQSLPAPAPAIEPQSVWAEQLSLNFTNPGVTNVVGRTEVYCALLDMHWSLGSFRGEAANGFPIHGGAGRVLSFMINRIGARLVDYGFDLVVTQTEFGHPYSPSQVQQIREWEDCTADFWSGSQAVQLHWDPPGSPIRYWYCGLRIDLMDSNGATLNDAPILVASGAML